MDLDLCMFIKAVIINIFKAVAVCQTCLVCTFFFFPRTI